MEQDLFKYYLPSEIINDIFLRLPAQSIAISKCVCRSWLDLLDKDEFVKSYFSRSPAALAVLAEIGQLSPCTVFELEDDEINVESSHDHRYNCLNKFIFPHTVEVLGSANGLLLLNKNYCEALYVWNPITREYMKLHLPQGTSFTRGSNGFGASKITGQHKVVHFRNYSDCHVYTLGTGSWRRVKAPFSCFYQNHGVFVNGNLHWLIRNSRWISCFDLETECFSTFSVSPVPPGGIEKVSILRDCLCLCDHTLKGDVVIVIWLMKEYGVEKSWMKEHVINLNPDFDRRALEVVITPIKVFKDGDILMQWGQRLLFYYSNKTKTSRKIGVFHKGYPNIYSVLLTPSFLSLSRFGMENVNPLKSSFLDIILGRCCLLE